MPVGLPAESGSTTGINPSPNRALKVSKRTCRHSVSPSNRHALIVNPSAAIRDLIRVISLGDASIPAGLPDGKDGWLSTGATTLGSTAMFNANPPVRHMPITPTPLPPHSLNRHRARGLSQLTMGLDLFCANKVN